ncbi:hypothetical protein [Spirosoma montaniterrae]|uniref:Uncharacterized protein n=1 Tax=Spirosoma montaniterrae TaxID=1178516 RepID=A0A1P9WVD8_9BACT|nr:hypothetical protein [Spirosoma montaniterrae]AQG79298.1 hypothetical protein AWR27_08155 [Spirosoma montaniterrae]
MTFQGRNGWLLPILVLLNLSCHRAIQPLSKTPKQAEKQPVLSNDWANKRRQGIDFVAVGSSPAKTGALAWQLDIDFAKQIQFQASDGYELLVPVPKPKPSSRGMGVLLDAQAEPVLASASRRKNVSQRSSTGKRKLVVSIEPTTYRDPLTKRDYAYTVRVEANARQYVGAGRFCTPATGSTASGHSKRFAGNAFAPNNSATKCCPRWNLT